MPGSRVRGDRGVTRMLRQLPGSVREEMAELLDHYGDRLLSAMRADVPVATGWLKSRLTKRMARKSLILRVGFVGKAGNAPPSRAVTTKRGGNRRRNNYDQFVGQFYGRFVEFGRKAQNVRVTRRAKVIRASGNNRPDNKRTYTYGAGVYTMRVKAMAPRPFVYKKRPGLRSELQQRIRLMWDDVLARTAEGTLGND